MRDLMRRSPAMCMSSELVNTLDGQIAGGLSEHLVRIDPSPDHAVGSTEVFVSLLGLAPSNGQSFVMVFARVNPMAGEVNSTADVVLGALGHPVITIGRDLAITFVNAAATALLGFPSDKLIGADIRALATDESVSDLSGHLAATSSVPITLQLALRRVDGEVLVEATTTLVREPEPCVVMSLHDLSGQAAQVASLAVLSTVDSLTGLANRQAFSEHLRSVLAASDDEVTVAFLDLDNFKTINDALGHDQGDLLLETVARRLEHTIGEHGLVARFGGDEFVVASSGIAGTGHDELAYLLDQVFSEPVELNGKEFRITVSVGVVTTEAESASPDGLLKAADTAMYEAKGRGKNCLAVYDDSLEHKATARMEIESDLRGALDRGEFVLHYQPIMDVISGRPVGAEALLRWKHPERGMVPPDEFIPVAEQTGIIVPLGAWVLEAAVEQAAEWNRHRVSRRALGISVNLSGLQLSDPHLEQRIHATLSRHGFDPERLTLEITESMLMTDALDTMSTLERLRDIGVRIAIDDFGTGYSSLAYLKRLPARALKIDKAFIDGLGVSTEDTSLVTGIIGLASALGFEIVAEGVETELQLKELRRLGCEYSQGYHHSRPLSADDFELWLGDDTTQTLVEAPAQLTVESPEVARTPGERLPAPAVFDQDTAAFGA
jgi:diguanylate cyclase (GGDEF)-like protein